MQDGWECTTAPWWVNRDELGTAYAQSGPKDWPRVNTADLSKAAPRTVTPARVSNVQSTVDKISFDVSEIGKPVEVKESYFPNWKVSGANGPYRLAPNLMVVVPTSKHVELTYGLTGADWAGRVITAGGAVGLVLLGLWAGARRYAAGDDPPEADVHDDDSPSDEGSEAGAPRGDGTDDENPDIPPDGPRGPPADPWAEPSEGEPPDRREPVRAVP